MFGMSAYLILGIVALLMYTAFAVGILVWRFASYRGQRVVYCPETEQPASVELDAWIAARSGLDRDEQTILRLKSCSRWPERQDCPQECLPQIEASPEGTLTRNIVAAWYPHKFCVYCARAIGEIAWHDRMPALRAPNGTLRDWDGIAAVDVPSILATHDAVCWNCNLIETFRRDHPDLVTDRRETELRDQLFH